MNIAALSTTTAASGTSSSQTSSTATLEKKKQEYEAQLKQLQSQVSEGNEDKVKQL